ncbi:VWA domain-containing protein [Kitasatospora sp. NBC_00240]|uniref:vWA domain-containing protein n=1 Tax=Kitasatospora sp. NBC_00240 TaxID=2903567 RepID=UPI00224F9BA8|nr:VWA domain-containing protein [Kitasatospora sp. NBC_00240]MCX5212349.1 VWA domain-containing protein [Kitasatospora sp. NBC_00240]
MQILPFYVMCDESGSMDANIGDLNDALAELHQEISTNPTVSDKTRFALIGFSTEAHELQQLVELSDIEELPALAASGLTSFGKAFETLHRAIERDVPALKAEGHDVFRPVVFFLSDGIPTDTDWERPYQELLASKFRPHIIAFGIGVAQRAVIAQVATFKAFMGTEDGVSAAVALKEFAASLTRSIVRSVSGATADGVGMSLLVDDHVPGFTSVSLDKL